MVVSNNARPPSLRSTCSIQQTLSPVLLPVAATPHPAHLPTQFKPPCHPSCLTLVFSPVMSWTSYSVMTLSAWSIRAKLAITFCWRILKYLIRFSYGTLHALRISHVMDCRQHYRGCSQHGVWWVIVRVVCLYRSQARRPNDL
jgi:hypothetical protein